MKKYLVILFSVFLTACAGGDNVVDFWVDNPTNQAIKVKIDKKEIDIPAESGINVDLLLGKHSLTFEGVTVKFFVKPSKYDGSIINPTLSNYIIYNQLKLDDPKLSTVDCQRIKTRYTYVMEIDSQKVRVPFTYVNSFVIDKRKSMWHFGVEDKFDGDAKVKVNDNLSIEEQVVNSIVLTKLFREKDFMKFEGDIPHKSNLVIPINAKKLNALRAYKFIEGVPAIGCEDADEHVKEVIKCWHNMLNASGSDVKKIYDELVKTAFFSKEMHEKCSKFYNKSIGNNNFDEVANTIGENILELDNYSAFVVE